MGSNPIPATLDFTRLIFVRECLFIVRLYGLSEVKALLGKGVKYGENGISHTTSRHSGTTYYLCESKRNMSILREIRK